MPNYKIADIIFNAEHHFPYVKNLCANYEYFGKEKPEITLNVSISDIKKEKSLYAEDKFTDDYCESLALYRKFLEYAINKETIILHSSALAVDDDAFLFTAPSGTGKSTHARLYRQAFLDRVTMINDDKPVIKKVGEDFYVFGTPWNGKHQLDTNSKFKIKAVCNLKRGEENKIYPISSSQMLFVLLNQTLYFLY